ncbi:MAG: glutaredoxin family protein [Verrucomicrobia bacterium]|nr:glutaredoxin family protein [Verrucomicrobiota bacterium]
MATLTVYTKPNCPLCEEAMEEIERARREIPFELVEVNILGDPETYERYRQAIPVVTLDGVEIFRYRLSCDELLKKLTA